MNATWLDSLLALAALVAVAACSGPGGPARPSPADAGPLLAERLAALDLELARQKAAGLAAAPVSFSFRCPDDAAAAALERAIAGSTPYAARALPGQGAGPERLVDGETSLLPNERPAHEPVVRVMIDLGLERGCELRSWLPRAAGG